MYRTIFSHVGEYKKQAVLCPLSIVGEVIMEVTIPLVTARMIDNGIKGGNISYVTGMGILMVCMALVSLFFRSTGRKAECCSGSAGAYT